MDSLHPHRPFQQELFYTGEIQSEKECSKCHKVKPLSDYPKRSDRKIGVHSRCKICINEAQRNAPKKPKETYKPTIEQKECSRCHQVKSISNFWTRPNRKIGIYTVCKQCENVARRKPERPPRAPIEQKECSRCHQVKPLSDFDKSKAKRIGIVSRCKKCLSETRAPRIYVPGRDRITPEKARSKSLKQLYGITAEEYDVMLKEQGGVCKVCGGPPKGKGRYHHVDHDHTTGKIRGLLCHKCNMALGMVQDSIEHLQKLINYIEANSSDIYEVYKQCDQEQTPGQPNEQKECPRCHQMKSISDFKKRGATSKCKQCLNEITPRRRAYEKSKYHTMSIDEIRKDQALWKQYEITLEEYNEIAIEQGGACKICGGPPKGKGRYYHVDHDHRTGKIRGLLCHMCNVALGMVQDSIEHLKAIINYLERAKQTTKEE